MCRSSFSEFTSKHGRDERYKGIEKARDRETYFNEHLAELRKKEKEEKEKAREQVSDGVRQACGVCVEMTWLEEIWEAFDCLKCFKYNRFVFF